MDESQKKAELLCEKSKTDWGETEGGQQKRK